MRYPERLQSLRDMLPPQETGSHNSVLLVYLHIISQGSFGFMTVFTHRFIVQLFPLPDRVKRAFAMLNSKLQNVAVTTTKPNSPLLIEADV